jgi:hypothetical protein
MLYNCFLSIGLDVGVAFGLTATFFTLRPPKGGIAQLSNVLGRARRHDMSDVARLSVREFWRINVSLPAPILT